MQKGLNTFFLLIIFLRHWGCDPTAISRGKKKLVELGYLVPVEKKRYDYIFYADANGLLWERDEETKRILDERALRISERSYEGFQKWLEKKQLEQQQNNGNQSDENNKKADEEE